MDAAELRARLAAPHHAAPRPAATPVPANAEAIAGRLSGDDMADLVTDDLVAAAVLVPIVLGPVPGVLLTKRAAHLTSHPGQISFPGGRVDPGDASIEAAALREAAEEIGLDPARVELAGRLEDYVTGTGFRISPVLGLLPPGVALEMLQLTPSAHEVDTVFELPLAVLLDPRAPQRQRTVFRGRSREYWVWPHPEHYIWGATAGILVNLAARLRGK